MTQQDSRGGREGIDTVREFFSAVSRQDYEALADCLADDVVQEHPFLGDLRIEGKEAFLASVRYLYTLLRTFELILLEHHPTTDPSTLIVEFRSEGDVIDPSRPPYRNRYIAVCKLEGGRIRHWREYQNPLSVSASLPIESLTS